MSVKTDSDVIPSDGRHLDDARVAHTGEAAGMRVDEPEIAYPAPRPAEAPAAASPTYYELPVVKPPPWKWYIPGYFYVGGLAGAAGALGAVAGATRRPELARLVRRSRQLSAAGHVAGAALLIADLGRPARFLNMLRVFRPTSPMNLGTWILTAGGATSTASLLLARRWPRTADAAGLATGALALPLATYTAVLLANTAMPAWAGARRTLPVAFAASAAASAASAYELMPPASSREERVVHRFSVAAKTAELVAFEGVRRELDAGGRGGPLRRGRSGRWWKSALVLGGASLAATLFGQRRTAGALGTAAAVAARFAVFEAGVASARDPRATFEPQRRRLEAAGGGRVHAGTAVVDPGQDRGRAPTTA